MSSGGNQKTYGAGEWLTAGLILVIGAPIALWFVSCNGSKEADPLSAEQTAQQEFLWIEHGKDAVRSKLKDPEAAEFRGTNVRRQTGSPLVCGEVNSRNSFGGRAGFQRFIFMGNDLGSVLEEELPGGEFQKLWDSTCLR